MLVQEVVNSLIHSYNAISMDSIPSIINLLGKTRRQKQEIIQQAYDQFIRYGVESIVLLSVCTSSSLYSWILTHTPKICYWKNRVVYMDKRYALIILYFCNFQPVQTS